jgi:hypothetical protein
MNLSGSILNLVGDVETRGTQKETIVLSSGTTLNMTGNAFCTLNTANSGVCISANTAVVNITGNLSIIDSSAQGNVNWYALAINNSCTVNVIGTISNDSTTNAMPFSYTVIFGGNGAYFNHVGPVIGGLRAPAIYNLVVGAINILTGPFISDPTGTQPLYISRMHYRRTIGSYFEFRNNSTNGALPPAASAPATRLVSPDTVVDAPSPTNVRFGITYALGSQTGTMRVPIPGAVAFGVEVDNTVGTALLSAAQVWNYLRNDISVSGSIGDRLKNCSTVESTGSQIASFKSS